MSGSTASKQRHTAKRVFERLRDEHGFTGGYTIVKDYMRQRERRGREMFVALAHPPGHARADFGEAIVIIARRRQRARTGGAALATPRTVAHRARTDGATMDDQTMARRRARQAHFFVIVAIESATDGVDGACVPASGVRGVPAARA